MSECKEKTRGVVDIVFLMDVTGSMQPCIDELKENIANFIDFLTVGAGGNDVSPVTDWRGKIMGYRDVEVDSEWIIDNDFVRDAALLKAQLDSLRADGGGDEPESLLEAIHHAASLEETAKGGEPDPRKWRYRSAAARVVVIFTDASFKEPMRLPELAGGGIDDINHLVTTKRLLLSIFAPDMSCYDRLCAIDKSEWTPIKYDRADPNGARKALVEFTRDRKGFTLTLKQLAASVSKSADVLPL